MAEVRDWKGETDSCDSIREFCELSTPVYMFDKDGNFMVMKLEQLLPLSFGPDALPPPEELEAIHKQLE